MKTMRFSATAATAATAAAAALAAALLSACEGPWSMRPETGPRPAEPWVSLLLVADRPLDTLWLERPWSLSVRRDSSAAFVDPAASALYVREGDAGPRIRYRPLAGIAAAWLPEDTAYRVRRGTGYHLEGTLRWNAAPDFPQGEAWETRSLAADTYVPAGYALDPAVRVPLEALHPSLSMGLPSGSVSRALADAGYRRSLFDSLDGLPGIKPLSAYGIGDADFLAYLGGKAVFRPLKREDTAYFIFDGAPSTDYSGVPTHRYSLPWLFTARFDREGFGGVILSEHFDPDRARIYTPLQKGLNEAFGQDLDSAEYFQYGSVRPMLTAGSYYSDLKGYPDTLRITNLLWGYTGRNVMYAYAVDSLYFEYYKGLLQSGMGSGGPGGGSSRAQNVLRYTNVRGGDGYFCGAVADSFAVNLRAVRDTIPNEALRAAWLRSRGP